MTVSDVEVGRNVATMRGNRSQADVASAMRDRGFKWSQTTVWKVESGERPLRFTEAAGLAEVLGADLSTFTTSTYAALVEQYIAKQDLLERDTTNAIQAFLRGQYELAACADFATDEGGPLSERTHERVQHLLTLTPERIARDERIAIRHAVESKEALREKQLSREDVDSADVVLSVPPNEDLYQIERDGRYDQMMDASWDAASVER